MSLIQLNVSSIKQGERANSIVRPFPFPLTARANLDRANLSNSGSGLYQRSNGIIFDH